MKNTINCLILFLFEVLSLLLFTKKNANLEIYWKDNKYKTIPIRYIIDNPIFSFAKSKVAPKSEKNKKTVIRLQLSAINICLANFLEGGISNLKARGSSLQPELGWRTGNNINTINAKDVANILIISKKCKSNFPDNIVEITKKYRAEIALIA